MAVIEVGPIYVNPDKITGLSDVRKIEAHNPGEVEPKGYTFQIYLAGSATSVVTPNKAEAEALHKELAKKYVDPKDGYATGGVNLVTPAINSLGSVGPDPIPGDKHEGAFNASMDGVAPSLQYLTMDKADKARGELGKKAKLAAVGPALIREEQFSALTDVVENSPNEDGPEPGPTTYSFDVHQNGSKAVVLTTNPIEADTLYHGVCAWNAGVPSHHTGGVTLNLASIEGITQITEVGSEHHEMVRPAAFSVLLDGPNVTLEYANMYFAQEARDFLVQKVLEQNNEQLVLVGDLYLNPQMVTGLTDVRETPPADPTIHATFSFKIYLYGSVLSIFTNFQHIAVQEHAAVANMLNPSTRHPTGGVTINVDAVNTIGIPGSDPIPGDQFEGAFNIQVDGATVTLQYVTVDGAVSARDALVKEVNGKMPD